MAQINPDILYIKSREDLLLYEDSRLNSLFNGTANFYLTKNDQSIWGAFLRALGQEIARLEFDYAYDLVGKEPQFLTPPDIKRRWADPLFVSSQYPGATQSDLDYRTMLVELLSAYRMGGTPQAIGDVIFAYTGLRVVVQELYKFIGDGIFDQSDRNAIRVSVNVGGTNPLLDITTLNQLQLIVNSLYGAIDLAKPAHVGLEFTTVFGSDENIDDFVTDISLSPIDGISDLLEITVRLVENEPFDPMLYQAPILDPANPLTTVAPYGRQFAGPLLTISSGDWAALPAISFEITNTVADGVNATYTYKGGNVTAVTVLGNVLTVTGANGLHAGMDVLLTGFNLASFLNDQVVTITTATGTSFTAVFTHVNYGFVNVTSTSVTSNVITVIANNSLVAGQLVLGSGFTTTTALNGQPLTVLPTGLSATQFTANFTHANYGPTSEAPGAIFTLQDSTGSAQPILHNGMQVTITGCRSQFNVTAQIISVFPNTFTIPLAQTIVSAAETGAGLVTPTIQAAYFPTGGSYTVGQDTWHASTVYFKGQIILDSNGNTQMAVVGGTSGTPNHPVWSVVLNGQVTDGSVTWRMVGFNAIYTASYKWIMLLNNEQPNRQPTGEIGNWDITHPIGLLAPRLNQAWEISGDTFTSFEMN